MASPITRLKIVFRDSFNPLRLLRSKQSIVPAMGHNFNEDLACNRCGREWTEQREEPSDCNPEADDTLVA
jgi:hypothetical protein